MRTWIKWLTVCFILIVFESFAHASIVTFEQVVRYRSVNVYDMLYLYTTKYLTLQLIWSLIPKSIVLYFVFSQFMNRPAIVAISNVVTYALCVSLFIAFTSLFEIIVYYHWINVFIMLMYNYYCIILLYKLRIVRVLFPEISGMID